MNPLSNTIRDSVLGRRYVSVDGVSAGFPLSSPSSSSSSSSSSSPQRILNRERYCHIRRFTQTEQRKMRMASRCDMYRS
ncbi:MAG: hypothetical protein WC763_06975 [Candidatus Paceibacterota bacterium]